MQLPPPSEEDRACRSVPVPRFPRSSPAIELTRVSRLVLVLFSRFRRPLPITPSLAVRAFLTAPTLAQEKFPKQCSWRWVGLGTSAGSEFGSPQAGHAPYRSPSLPPNRVPREARPLLPRGIIYASTHCHTGHIGDN